MDSVSTVMPWKFATSKQASRQALPPPKTLKQQPSSDPSFVLQAHRCYRTSSQASQIVQCLQARSLFEPQLSTIDRRIAQAIVSQSDGLSIGLQWKAHYQVGQTSQALCQAQSSRQIIASKLHEAKDKLCPRTSQRSRYVTSQNRNNGKGQDIVEVEGHSTARLSRCTEPGR